MSFFSARIALLVALLACFATGCSPKPIGRPVVWPEAPETPRIRFVTAFRHTSDLDNSTWSNFWRKLTGAGDDQGLGQPMGVAISDDDKRLYIADFSMGHVFLADFEGRRLRQFAPDEAMGKPFNVALDAQENVYVSDSVGKVVHVFNRKGEPLINIGRSELDRPTGIAIDRARGRIYVSDSSTRGSQNHRVRAFTLEGKHLFDLGPRRGEGGKGDQDGQFYFPTYLTLDTVGNVYVADTMNFRIQVFGPDGKFLRKYGEHGDRPGDFAQMKGLAFDSFGNLYVVDGGHSTVQIFNREFQGLLFFGGYSRKMEFFDVPSGIAIGHNNRIYVCNEFVSRINVYELFNTKAEDSVSKAPVKNAPGKPPESRPLVKPEETGEAAKPVEVGVPTKPAEAGVPAKPEENATPANP